MITSPAKLLHFTGRTCKGVAPHPPPLLINAKRFPSKNCTSIFSHSGGAFLSPHRHVPSAPSSSHGRSTVPLPIMKRFNHLGDANRVPLELKATINLPKTAFPMKANLPQNEPKTLERCEQMKLYDRIRQARRGAPLYTLHDA